MCDVQEFVVDSAFFLGAMLVVAAVAPTSPSEVAHFLHALPHMDPKMVRSDRDRCRPPDAGVAD